MTLFINGPEEISEFIKKFNISNKQVSRALRKAMDKTLRTLAVGLSKEVAEDTGVKVRFIRRRIKHFINKEQKIDEGVLSMVTASIPAFLLGPKPTSLGVKAGKFFFRGSFVAPNYSGDLPYKVYKRRYRTRLPLKEMRVPIDKISHDEIQKLQHLKMVEDLLFENFAHELEFVGGFIK